MVCSAQLAEGGTTGVVRNSGQLPKGGEFDFAQLAEVRTSSVVRSGGHLPKALLGRKFANLAQKSHRAPSTPVVPNLGQSESPLKAPIAGHLPA